MTRYFTKVADEMMPLVRDGERLPSCLRLVREVRPDGPGVTLVEFEDDEAPDWLSGRTVEPIITRETAEVHEGGPVFSGRIWISERIVFPGGVRYPATWR